MHQKDSGPAEQSRKNSDTALVAISELLMLTKQIRLHQLDFDNTHAHISLIESGPVQPATSLPSLPLENRQTFHLPAAVQSFFKQASLYFVKSYDLSLMSLGRIMTLSR